MKLFQLLLFALLCLAISNNAESQKVIIVYYDETMHVVDIEDYWIHHQSEKEHFVIIEDSTIVSFFHKHISELKQCDSIPQSVNSLVKIIYVFQNGNFDVLTFCPQSSYMKKGICKNGRMFNYDRALDKMTLLIINDSNNDIYRRLGKSKIKALKELISKMDE